MRETVLALLAVVTVTGCSALLPVGTVLEATSTLNVAAERQPPTAVAATQPLKTPTVA